MEPRLSEKFIAYLTLLSGLAISGVAVYYSVSGLAAIFSAAVIPIIIMGTTLELSKLVATVWLKQNWSHSPALVKIYLILAVIMLMMITNIGIFGFLSRAHSDQNLVSGSVQSQLAVYDEKIKTAKENIEVNRRALRQLDEAVEQVMSRSTSEQGADKANSIRRSQQKDRNRILSEISQEQKTIAQLNEESAQIRAEFRKVEAEVGPIKYVADFFYGKTDESTLERAVTWMIICIIVVFDPLAIVLLLASQYSFSYFATLRNSKEEVKPESVVLPEVEVPETTAETSIEDTVEETGSDWEEITDHEIPAEVEADNDFEFDDHPDEDVIEIANTSTSIAEQLSINSDDYEEYFEEDQFDIELDNIIRNQRLEEITTNVVPLPERGYIQNEEQLATENSIWRQVNDVISRRQYEELVKRNQT